MNRLKLQSRAQQSSKYLQVENTSSRRSWKRKSGVTVVYSWACRWNMKIRNGRRLEITKSGWMLPQRRNKEKAQPKIWNRQINTHEHVLLGLLIISLNSYNIGICALTFRTTFHRCSEISELGSGKTLFVPQHKSKKEREYGHKFLISVLPTQNASGSYTLRRSRRAKELSFS